MNFSARYLSVENNNTRYSNSEFRHYLCLYSSYTKPPIGKSLISFLFTCHYLIVDLFSNTNFPSIILFSIYFSILF